jgi:CheY-like chemotaxis protein
MNTPSKYRVLVVDDDSSIRDLMVMLLEEAGYEVSTAEDGLGALAQIRRLPPAVIISDLNMPQMSGFELLSVVRRRFPEIPVVAMSGAYDAVDRVPGGVIADAFYSKGKFQLEQLLRTLGELIQTSAARAIDHQRKLAPVWIPLNDMDSTGIPFITLTCTECLRSFRLRGNAQRRSGTPGNILPLLLYPPSATSSTSLLQSPRRELVLQRMHRTLNLQQGVHNSRDASACPG